jgi:YfiH family protein
VPRAFIAASFEAKRPAKWIAGSRRRVQYAISPSVKMRVRKRVPYRSMVLTMRGMSVASIPRPMIFGMTVNVPPKPNDGFAWVQVAGGPALVCEALGVPHFFTTRSWALGSAAEADRGGAWETVGRSLELDAAQLCRARQVHGASVVIRRAADPACGAQPLPEADILLTDDPARGLAIQTADCVPLLIADPRTGAVAAAHAGWQGMAAGVPRTAVAALARAFGSRPEDLVAVAGPSVGACCYEVGADVRDAFRRGGFADASIDLWFFTAPQPTARNRSMPGLRAAPRADHWFFDGWAATQHQLEEAGVPRRQIHAAGLCTASHPQLCSYRRDGALAGRLAAAIRMPAA